MSSDNRGHFAFFILYFSFFISLVAPASAYKLEYRDAPGVVRTYLGDFTCSNALKDVKTQKVTSTTEVALSRSLTEHVLDWHAGRATLQWDDACEMKNDDDDTPKSIFKQDARTKSDYTLDRIYTGRLCSVKALPDPPGAKKDSSKPVLPFVSDRGVYLAPYGQTLIFPDAAINDGFTWHVTGKTEISLAQFTVNAQYDFFFTIVKTVVRNDKPLVRIDSAYTITCPKQTYLLHNRIDPQRTIAIATTGKTTFYFDEKAGEILSSTVEETMVQSLTTMLENGTLIDSVVTTKTSGTVDKYTKTRR